MAEPKIAPAAFDSAGEADHEKGVPADVRASDDNVPKTAADAVRDIKSPGVRRVEALASVMTLADRIFIFLGVFLVAYAYGLDGTLRYAYQPTATGSFGNHSLTSTVSVIRAIIGAAAQPTAGKIADVFGRVELIIVSAVFYVVGTIVEAVAGNVATLAAGTAIYQIGYTMVILLVEIIIADLTSTRARVFFSYVPGLPFLINTWVSGNIAAAVLANTTWRWGYGMWAIIYPVCTLPLIASLYMVSRRARKRGLLDDYRSSMQILGVRNFALELFWALDVIGILLLIAVFDLILVPMTLAGGLSSKWKSAGIIAPLVIGVLCIPAFIIWELRAPHPLVPFRLMKDRGVWSPILIAITLNFAWAMQGDFLFTVLIVAFDFGTNTATRVTNLYSFVSLIVGPIIGVLVYFIRRLKIFVIAGTSLFMVAFGLLIHYRGASPDGSGQAGVIGAQVVLGIAGGLFPYTAQASLQVQLQHENLAVMTGLFLAVYNIGSAFGNTVSGAIWTQTLPQYLEQRIEDQDIVAAVYGNPLVEAVKYPMGTPTRIAIVSAYRDAQKLLTITGIVLCVPLIGLAFALRNPQLNESQTLAKEESESEDDTEAGAPRN